MGRPAYSGPAFAPHTAAPLSLPCRAQCAGRASARRHCTPAVGWVAHKPSSSLPCSVQGTVARVEPLRTIMHLEDGALGERYRHGQGVTPAVPAGLIQPRLLT